jgi:hypothetical protein
MADTVDTAASSSSADEAEKPQDGRAPPLENEAADREEAAEGPEAPEATAQESAEPKEEPEQPRAREEETHEPEVSEAEPEERDEEPEAAEGEPEERDEEPEATEEEPEERDEEPEAAEEAGPSLTELVEELGHQLTELGVAEAQLQAARNMPGVRQAVRDVAGALVVVVAAITAFAFINVAAMDGLSRVLATWLAALLLAAFWLVVAGVLLFGVMGRARQWLLWIVLKAPPSEAVEEIERERNEAGKAALGTLERLGPALAIQIALAAMPKVGDVAEDVAGGVVEVGGSVIEASDEIVEVVTEQITSAGVVNQVWSVALTPGRYGIKVATTVLKRGRPAD